MNGPGTVPLLKRCSAATPSACPERIALLQEYAHRTKVFTEAVEALRTAQDSVEVDAFVRSFEQCKLVRGEANEVMHRLFEHVRQHGCGLWRMR